MVCSTPPHHENLEKLGEGRTGVVDKTGNLMLDRPVVLKFLAPDLSGDQPQPVPLLMLLRTLLTRILLTPG
jgi:hypothetical protein